MDYTVLGILQARIMEYLSLLQGIFPTQKSNLDLLHCRQILYQLSYEGSPIQPIFKLPFRKTFYFIYLNTHGNSHHSGCINTLKTKAQRLAQVCCIAGTSLVAQSVKILPAMQEIQV